MATAEVQLNRVTRRVSRLEDLAAFLFYRNTRPPRDGPAPDIRAGAAQDAGRAKPRGRGAAIGGRTWTEVQGDTEHAYAAGLRVSEVVAR